MPEKEVRTPKIIYKTIHDAAILYAETGTGADRLIDLFAPVVDNYTKCVKNPEHVPTSSSVRKFAILFNKYKSANKLARAGQRSQYIKNSVEYGLARIHSMFFNENVQDIRTSAIITLLKMAKRYKSKKPTFHTYVKNYFPYEFKKSLLVLKYNKFSSTNVKTIPINPRLLEYAIKESAENNTERALELVESSVFSCNKLSNFSPGYDKIDANWIIGNTCSEIFSKLTVFERRILRDYYITGLSMREMAEQYGVTFKIVRTKKEKIINKLSKTISESKK